MRSFIAVILGGFIIGGTLLYLGSRNNGTQSVGHSGQVAAGTSQPAPDFTLAKLGGGQVSLAEYRGKKPVIVDFWATWCPNCRRDMPNLNRFYQKYEDQIAVIGINLQEPESAASKFIAERGILFPIALDPAGLASGSFGIRYTNTHILIDKQGNIVKFIPGDIREQDFKSLL